MSSPSSDGAARASRSVVSWIILAGLIVAGVLLWVNRATVTDDFRLIGYTPPANIAALANDIKFTSEGQRDFYASHPAIEDKTAFNKDCDDTEINATILGCYTHYSIYVYNVTDPRLNGVQEVTAAHETLHAAYARLSDSEKSTVDAMLQRQYDSMSGDTAFIQRFSVYNSDTQAEKLNELHSIFGTEVSNLSGELENYYKQYFTNRSIVTSYYNAYEGQFNSLNAEQQSLESQIQTLKTEINNDETRYESDRSALNDDIQTFNSRASGGYYSNQSDFDNDRAALVQRSDDLNQTATDINDEIDKYNGLIQQYNEVSIQTEDLQNSLNSNSVQSAPSV